MFNTSLSIFDLYSPVLFESEYVNIRIHGIQDEIRVKVPGLSADDIKVNLIKGQYLKITGENKETKSKVCKGFRLDYKIDGKDLSVKCCNGLLTIKLDTEKVKTKDVVEIPVIG